jgi:hypothetical protein
LARYAGALAGEPRGLSRRIEWQEHSAGEMVSDPVAVLWTGEVLFNRGPGGISSPLYALEAAAEAWAFGSALRSARNGRVFRSGCLLALRGTFGGASAREGR